ncbi:hypothetical protein FPSE_05129 [Fusarium pseudograminearum CS3096]|uniref:Uncharacterized protein n=1 Tax=Fusarium pseudograminearum (strain CS3096) TaxID=1028729 RepID=K3UQI2_FUSPC|nr:hypothetical protein FPSE_05129 [Fusarium pseudograminearum CS3096]EKJ74661.1 hypothetical protein FPSE_05129 [Fusarium pseudograminearum CS3096]KAF0645338.1 hypothetical protein FPSE5266_05129 [Fusarium pseudograminearum]
MRNMSILGAGKTSSHSLLVQTQDVRSDTFTEEASSWPNHPKTLDYGWKVIWLFPLVLIWVPFIVLAFFIHGLNDKPISAHGDAVLEAIGLASTLWPIALAAVLGALVRTVALFRAEQGTELGTLAILLGSQTLINTIKTAFVLRMLSVWTLVLFVLWTFSPLGGQAVLRTIRTKSHISSQEHKISYIPAADAGPPLNFALWESSSTRGDQLGRILPMFGAALSAPNALAQASNGSSKRFDAVIKQLGGVDVASKDAKVDLWGNVRVPEITQLPGYNNLDLYNWIKVPSDQLATYESLIGIPIRGIPSNSAGNFTLQISASYIALECSSWFNTSEWLSRIPNGLRSHKTMNASIVEEKVTELNRGTSHTYMDIPNGISGSNSDFNFSSEDRYSIGPVKRGTLVFGTRNNSTICDMSNVYVDVDIKCDRPRAFETMVCQALSVRHSRGHGVSIPSTNMTTNRGTAPGAFISALPWLTQSFHPGVKSPFENYLTDPALGMEDDLTGGFGITTEFTRLPLKVFAQRLALVINTAMRVSYYAPAVLSFGNINMTEMEDWMPGMYAIQYTNTTGDFTTSEERYQVQNIWMAIYIVSLILMGISLLATVSLSLVTRAPDFLTSISALTRDSVHINVPAGGSTYCGDERATLLKNRRLKIRDVQPDEDIGYVALADDNSHGNRGLKAAKKRLYA